MNKTDNEIHLRLFVYGTLKRGFWNHDRFCSRAVGIEPATTWGRLYHLPAGFVPCFAVASLRDSPGGSRTVCFASRCPALEVPDTCILAHGTADPITDARTQNIMELPENAMAQPDGDWDLVHGELMTFANPDFDLPPIDRLEGFNPNGQSMYQRI